MPPPGAPAKVPLSYSNIEWRLFSLSCARSFTGIDREAVYAALACPNPGVQNAATASQTAVVALPICSVLLVTLNMTAVIACPRRCCPITMPNACFRTENRYLSKPSRMVVAKAASRRLRAGSPRSTRSLRLVCQYAEPHWPSVPISRACESDVVRCRGPRCEPMSCSHLER
jgi:hypothetical protein